MQVGSFDRLLLFLLLMQLGACAQNTYQNKRVEAKSSVTPSVFLPADHRVLLILGQDLDSVSDYVNSGYFPPPGGVTTYVSFYNLSRASFPAFGALGQDLKGNAQAAVVDWGAGPLNAHQLVLQNPFSALVIGLNIAEGNGNNLWAEGGLADIGVGAYDDNIRRLARFCKEINRPVYLRIGYEFDGAWNRGYEKKTSYIIAFRRIVSVMREQGVINVAYVWQASASPVDDVMDGLQEDIRLWYPGDGYVDWMGLSWFLTAEEKRQNIPTQRMLADEVLNFARLRDKPVMIAESAPQGYDLAQNTRSNSGPLWDGVAGSDTVSKSPLLIWQEWFAPLFEYIHANADVIRALAYINADWDAQKMWSAPYAQGYWGDSRLQVNSEIRKLWLQEINDTSFWQHASQDPAGQ